VSSLLTVPLSAQAAELPDAPVAADGSIVVTQTRTPAVAETSTVSTESESEPAPGSEPEPEAVPTTHAPDDELAQTPAPAATPEQTEQTTLAPTEAAQPTKAAASAAVKTLTLTSAPRISGAAKLGTTLTATAGSWVPTTVALSYQWKRSATVITGANKATYKVAAADLGKTLSVTVTGTKTGYLATATTSAPTGRAFANFTSTPVPTISGTALTGMKLTAVPGTWTPGSAVLSYQWKRSGTTITGATGRTYLVAPTDVDRTFTVTVTAKLPNYVTVSKQSAATRVIVGKGFPNCTALNAVYPHGVAKAGTKYDRVSGVNNAFKGQPFFSTALYNLNPASDRDKDGIACEK
jgi:hypothetical protein